MSTSRSKGLANRVIEVFRHNDQNDDGFIRSEKLVAVLQALDPARWNAATVGKLLEAYGKVYDDEVNYSDFFAWLLGGTHDLVRSCSFKQGQHLADTYEFHGSELGAGAFGTVRKATHRTTGVTRAVKTIRKSMTPSPTTERQQRLLDMEIAIMKRLDHPNIVRLFDTYDDVHFVHFVMDLCNGGELLDRILGNGRFSERQAAAMLSQAVGGISYLHRSGICHRDLKLQNLLVRDKDVPLDHCTIKIIDFGLACTFEANTPMKTMVGTPLYTAPEVLTGSYTKACDLWACGVIMYVVLSGLPPFQGKDNNTIFAAARRGDVKLDGELWQKVTHDAKDLVRKLIELDPKARYTAKQAAGHAWITHQAPASAECPLEDVQLSNMREFSKRNKLEKATIHIIAQRLPETKIQHLRDTFTTLDANGDGIITFRELQNGLETLAGLSEDLVRIISDIDSDWNHCINYGEFLAAALDQKLYLEDRICWEAFQVFDRDQSGEISHAELLQVLHSSDIESIMGSVATARVMEQCDTDGDGSISFGEFMRMLRTPH